MPHQALPRLLLFLIAMLSAACPPPDSSRCAAESKHGACVNLVSVRGYDAVGDIFTGNVDVFQDVCEIPNEFDPSQPFQVDEPFGDHAAVLAVSNDPPVDLQRTPERAPVVVFDRFRITYTVNDCVTTCPTIEPVELQVGPTFMVEPAATVELTLPLVALRKKIQYVTDGGPAFEFPSYSATYELLGFEAQQGDGDERPLTLTGSTEFSVGAFSNCAALLE